MDQEANRLLQKFTLEELIEYEGRLAERIYELKLEQLSSYKKLIPAVSFMTRLINESNLITKKVNGLLHKSCGDGNDNLNEVKCQLLLKNNKLDDTYLGRLLYLQSKGVLGPIKLEQVAINPSPLSCLLSLLIKKQEKIKINSFGEFHSLIENLKSAPFKSEIRILGPDLFFPEGPNFDPVLVVEKPEINAHFIEGEVEFCYDVIDKKQHLQMELEFCMSSEIDYRIKASKVLEEFIVKKLASRENILNLDLLLRLYELTSPPNCNNQLLLPSMPINEDPFYYYSILSFLSTDQPRNDFSTKLSLLGESGKKLYEARLNAQLEECLDAFDVFILQNRIAIEQYGKMHIINPFISNFCEKKGFKLHGVQDSFTFGKGLDYSERHFPFEPIPENSIPRFSLPTITK